METWLPVTGFEGYYEVSSEGRVRSMERTIIRRNRWRECEHRLPSVILAPETNNRGYLRVGLTRDKKQRKHAVHILVCQAFHGPRPEDMQACHNDGVKANCAATNVRWDTPLNNIHDRDHIHGTHYQIAKTECPQGHPYDEANTYWFKTASGWGRHCRTCRKLRERMRRANVFRMDIG